MGIVGLAGRCHSAGPGGGGGSDASVCATPCNQIITVSASAVSCSDAVIKVPDHEVAWRTTSATATLSIVFDTPSPFPNLRCEAGGCFSGKADENAVPVGGSKTFYYTASAKEPGEAQAKAAGAGPAFAPASFPVPTPTPSAGPQLRARIIIQR